ncbi:uncharacterized protein METZ01_LOCUS111770, partial [marine metagenome]
VGSPSFEATSAANLEYMDPPVISQAPMKVKTIPIPSPNHGIYPIIDRIPKAITMPAVPNKIINPLVTTMPIRSAFAICDRGLMFSMDSSDPK